MVYETRQKKQINNNYLGNIKTSVLQKKKLNRAKGTCNYGDSILEKLLLVQSIEI